ncbi:PadR family transcriptional regulator [Metallosphaera tengchongensis]|uniref:PadR family transcriptional regulator n=1 Tax=Metallosphaera tengchongensis TaxID=1532350 RepID=A0A6N0NT91_9CREN|nr:PadR family transcriptional regulator [Metallosphaera tengchongensis]QKQ99122.1 PadR family transcriptional regulator [Metallosphaera tengchongensis]
MRKTEMILRGILTLYVLSEIMESPMTGYELEKTISRKFNVKLPKGSIYVILRNAERKNLLRYKEDKNRKGQILKKYVITEEGRKFFLEHEEPLSIAKEVMSDLLKKMEIKRTEASAPPNGLRQEKD